MARITIEPLAVQIDCSESETLFAAARRQNVPIPTACVGRGTCGLCRVKVILGENNLPPVSETEKRHLGNTYFLTKLRLACQVQPSGDLTLQIPDAPRGAKLLPTVLPKLGGKR